MEIADVDEDDFVHAIEEDGGLFSTLKLSADDEETYKALTKMWEDRGDKQVYFTVLRAVGQQKWISGRYKE